MMVVISTRDNWIYQFAINQFSKEVNIFVNRLQVSTSILNYA